MESVPHPSLKSRLKRGTDIVMSLGALSLLAPALALVGVVVRISLGSPVLFRQTRTGLRAESFELIKFRTMTDARDPSGELLPDAVRLTRLGRWLRRTSLDELPTFANVLRGEMSLVGPRPLLPRYVRLYTDEQARRHEVRPGVTGWSQIHGRNAVTWDVKLALDVWYVEHWSLVLDWKILLGTVAVVLRGTGVSHSEETTMPEFRGTEKNTPDG